MSDAILLTGKRGNGKSLGAVGMIQRYLQQGRIVATNLDLRIENLLPPSSKARAYRLPDHPNATDLEAMPMGNDEPLNEERNGLLVLDELATFLNSREWQGKERQAIINWLVQSRKYGWDLLVIAQHPRLIDAQIRDALIEIHGQARRLDKVRVPLIGPIWKALTGQTLRFPKIHVVSLFYGFGQNAPLWDRWFFRGAALWEGYDSCQKISSITGNQALYSYLSPWHIKGRYLGFFGMYKQMIFGIAVLAFLAGLGGGYGLSWYHNREKSAAVAVVVPDKISDTVTVSGVVRDDSMFNLILSDGRSVLATGSKSDSSGERFLADGTWYKVKK